MRSITAILGARVGPPAGAASCATATATLAAAAPSTSAARDVLVISTPVSESSTHGELERRARLEGIAVRVDGVDEAERHVEHGHDEAQLRARGGAQVLEAEALVLQEGLAGVEEEDEPERPADVEVVLGVEQHVLVAAQRA